MVNDDDQQVCRYLIWFVWFVLARVWSFFARVLVGNGYVNFLYGIRFRSTPFDWSVVTSFLRVFPLYLNCFSFWKTKTNKQKKWFLAGYFYILLLSPAITKVKGVELVTVNEQIIVARIHLSQFNQVFHFILYFLLLISFVYSAI